MRKKLMRKPDWRSTKLRGGTHMTVREVVGMVSWDGWGNLPEPWRSAWAKLEDPTPGLDNVVRVAVSAMRKAIAGARRSEVRGC